MTGQNDRLATFSQHFHHLIRYTTAIVGSQAVAEDVVQEAWFRFDRPPSDKHIQQPEQYLYRIVRNLALDVLRRQQTEQRYIDASRPHDETSASIVDLAYTKQALQIIETALQELPERTRIVFQNYRSGEKTMQQIAEQMQISVGLVHKLLRDAMTHCARALGNLHD